MSLMRLCVSKLSSLDPSQRLIWRVQDEEVDGSVTPLAFRVRPSAVVSEDEVWASEPPGNDGAMNADVVRSIAAALLAPYVAQHNTAQGTSWLA